MLFVSGNRTTYSNTVLLNTIDLVLSKQTPIDIGTREIDELGWDHKSGGIVNASVIPYEESKIMSGLP